MKGVVKTSFDTAFRDPNLLGSTFAHDGAEASWRMALVSARAALGEELNRQERRLLKKIARSRKPPKRAVREAWWIVGRRGGKSRIASALAVYLAACVDYSHVLTPGEVGTVLLIANDVQQAKIVFRYILGLLESSPLLGPLVVRKTSNEIDLRVYGNTVTITVQSSSFRGVRGKTLIAVIMEECAFYRSEESANPDTEVYRAVLPGLATTGGMLIGISSPYRRAGLLHEKYREHFGEDSEDVIVFQAETLVFNPTLDEKIIKDAYRDDPVAARAEYGAEFRDDISGFLDTELLETLTRPAPLELPPSGEHSYHAFTDPSGGRGDSFTLAIAHEEDERVVIDAVRAHRPPFDPKRVVTDYADLLRAYGLRRVTGDNYSAAWVEGAFRDADVYYEISKVSASEIYREALPLFTRGIIELPPDRGLLTELGSLERRVAPQGREVITHPPRGHDDRANAACGAARLVADATGRQIEGSLLDHAHIFTPQVASGFVDVDGYDRRVLDYYNLPDPVTDWDF